MSEKIITVTYTRQIKTPRATAGEVGDVRDLPAVMAKKLIADGYVEKVTAKTKKGKTNDVDA